MRLLRGVACLLALAVVPAIAQEQGRKPLAQSVRVPEWGLELRFPEGWTHGKPFANAHQLTAPRHGNHAAGRVTVTVEQRTSHEDAVERLGQVANEYPVPKRWIVVDGWPALQRRLVVPKPMPGEAAEAAGAAAEEPMVVRITTAIAAGDRLVRIEGTLEEEMEAELADAVEAVGRSATFDTKGDAAAAQSAIERLMATPPPSPSTELPPAPAPLAPAAPAVEPAFSPVDELGAPVRVHTGSEISVVASISGRNVVVATNSGYSFSTNGGVSFSARQTVPNGPLSSRNGDPSLALGQSGNVYYALIGFPSTTQNSTSLWMSTDNGQTFAWRSNAVVCKNQSNPPKSDECFADQEHIAADRWNAASGGDQVYSTWRNFDDTDQDPGLVCSQDSAQNWTAPITVGSGVKPRIGVGQDGFVYVVWLQGNNVMLHKYTSCANGLAAQAGFPKTVANINEVTCGVPGLDRCTGRNTLASYTVAVDDTSASHVYVAVATNTSNNVNEDVRVWDSTDGGATWPRSVQVSAGGNARRFMPWMCTVGGAAHVTWYDRRFTVGASTNDLTDFYRGSAFVSGGNLVAGPEVRLTDTSDSHCASGWPCATDRVTDSETCSVQPQPAGICKLNPVPNPDTSSNARCDFSDCGVDNNGNFNAGNVTASCSCPSNERCSVGRGCPKYGDYNYSYCAAGRVYAAWASATAPSTLPSTGGNIDTFVDVALVCCVPQIQAQTSVSLPATCAGDTGTSPLQVCNTGKENLVVSSITSSSATFSVTDAFPQVITAGACRNFTVSFAPASRGLKTATLTINSNDTVNPAVAVAASGTGKGLVSIACPADRSVGNDPGLCSAVVNVGAPTVDAEGCPATVTAARSDGLPLASAFPVGITTVTWTAKDGGNNAQSCNQQVEVKDVEPPKITNLAATPSVLWPPNHKMADVAVGYKVKDNCDAVSAISCSPAAASSEPVDGLGDGDTSPDWLILGAKALQLRAERSGTGPGRLYTVTLTCTDTKSNSSSAPTGVSVPHDRR